MLELDYHITNSSPNSFVDTKYVFRHKSEIYPTPGMDELGFHYHTTYELLYFLRGEADYQIEQNHYTLHPHSLLIIKPGDYHSMIVKSDKRLDRIVIHFNIDDIDPALAESLATLSNVYYIPGTKLSDEILRLDAYYHDIREDLRLSVMISQLQIILAYMCNIVGMRQEADHVDYGAEFIISYIHNNLSSIRTVDDICKNVHMSRTTVQNLISEYLQTPVMSYVRTRKCIMARSLLQKGNSATAVSLQCGFSDYSSFYRAYCKVFGAPPSSVAPILKESQDKDRVTNHAVYETNTLPV